MSVEILVFSLSCILPFFCYLSIGYASKRLLKIKPESFIDINKLAFYTLLPANLFMNIYGAELGGMDFAGALVFSVLGLVAAVVIFWTLYQVRDIHHTDRSVLIQAAFRTNFILFGIPLTGRILGHEPSGLAGLITAAVIPAFNVLAIIVLTVYSGEKMNIRKLFRDMAKNPLLEAVAAAVLLNAVGYRLHDMTLQVLKSLAAAAVPVALMALGGRFVFARDSGGIYYLVEAIFFRLILIPAVATGIAVFLGFRGEALALILVLFGSPTSVTSYTMAQQMGGNERLAAQLLVYGTLFSSLSLFVFISFYKAAGLF